MLLHRQHLDIEPPALVSAGPWQGLDATAYLRICVFVCCRIWRNKERIIIIGGLGRIARIGGPGGTAPGGESDIVAIQISLQTTEAALDFRFDHFIVIILASGKRLQ